MVLIPGLVGFLLVLTADARVGLSSESPICTDETKECLHFDRVCGEKSEPYEVRYYSSLKWASTDESGWLMEAPTYRAFWSLYKYITGANEQSAKIDMTSPVVVNMSSVYTMSFLLPSEHQANPPRPTDPKVYIMDMPDVKVYVRYYGGYMSSASNGIQSYYLRRDLDKAGAKYSKDFYYAAGYNSPMAMWNRRNEVWYVVEGEHVCPP